MKELTKIKIVAIVSFPLIFIGLALITLDLGIFYEKIDDIQSIKTIEQEERKKLHIPDNVVIDYIFDDKINKYIYRYHGYVDMKKSSHNHYFIYLEKPTKSSIIRHEIYHVYRFVNMHPSWFDPNFRKELRLPIALGLAIREQFLAYIYGWFGINLEF